MFFVVTSVYSDGGFTIEPSDAPQPEGTVTAKLELPIDASPTLTRTPEEVNTFLEARRFDNTNGAICLFEAHQAPNGVRLYQRTDAGHLVNHPHTEGRSFKNANAAFWFLRELGWVDYEGCPR